MTRLECPLANRCSGCDRIELDRAGLEADRLQELEALGLTSSGSARVPVEFSWIEAGALRDRLEFTLTPHAFGLFEQKKPDGSRPEIVDIETCAQLTPALQNWLREFRKDLPPVQSPRSVRLRVSPTGQRGAWLDFANEDIRDLLDDGSWLERQLEKDVVIEVGQKRKRVVRAEVGTIDDKPARRHRLIDPVLEPWFETHIELEGRRENAALFSTIGTFTQVGFRANHALIEAVMNHARGFKRVAEFGAGIGNFTLPLLSLGSYVDVFESDRLALSALEKGVATSGLEASKLQIHAGDFILSAKAAERALGGDAAKDRAYDLVVVDPPRPGVGLFIDAISAHAAGASWVYVSCYPESLAKDAAALKEKGLELERLTVVEQFPFTRHFEVVASFKPTTR